MRQVRGVCEGRGGPALPPEIRAISLPLLPALMRHFPLHCLPQERKRVFSEHRGSEPSSAEMPSQRPPCLWMPTPRMPISRPAPPWGCFSFPSTPSVPRSQSCAFSANRQANAQPITLNVSCCLRGCLSHKTVHSLRT